MCVCVGGDAEEERGRNGNLSAPCFCDSLALCYRLAVGHMQGCQRTGSGPENLSSSAGIMHWGNRFSEVSRGKDLTNYKY